MVDPRGALVVGLVEGQGERSAGEFFADFAADPEGVDLGALPAGEALDLLFDDETD